MPFVIGKGDGAAGSVAGDYVYKQNANGELELWKGDERIAVQSPDGNWFTDSITTGVGSFHLGGVHSIGSAGQNVTFKNNQTNVAWFPVWQGQSIDGATLYNATVRNLDADQVVAEPNGAVLTTGSVDYNFTITAAANVSFTKLQFVIAENYTGVLHWTAAIAGTSNLLADIDVGTKTTAYTTGTVVTIAFDYPLDLRENDSVDLKIVKKNSDPKNQVVKCRAGATDNTKPYRKTWSRGFFDAEVAYEGNESDKKQTTIKAKKDTTNNNQTTIKLRSATGGSYYSLIAGSGGTNVAAKDSVRYNCVDTHTSLEYNQGGSKWARCLAGYNGSSLYFSFGVDGADSGLFTKTSATLSTQTGTSGASVIRLALDSGGSQISGPSGNTKSSYYINDTIANINVDTKVRALFDNAQSTTYSPDTNSWVYLSNVAYDIKVAGNYRMLINDTYSLIKSPNGNGTISVYNDSVTLNANNFSLLQGTNSQAVMRAPLVGGKGIWLTSTIFGGDVAYQPTSDKRKKTEMSDIPDELLDVWVNHVKFGVYKMLDSMDKNHVGVYAQDIQAAFSAAGLDWREWGIVSEHEGVYCVSYNDVFAIESALMRRYYNKMEDMLSRYNT